MRNALKYYYDIDVDDISYDGENYIFDNYVLKKLCAKIDYNIYNYFLQNNYYIYKIVPNVFKKYETIINESAYILLIVNKTKNINLSLLVSFNKKINIEYDINWTERWMIKVDYYEKLSIKLCDSVMRKYFPYYIGLAENAIKYSQLCEKKYTTSFSHRRIVNEIDFYSPDNIIIDVVARDLSEYIKNKFFLDELDSKEINYIIDNMYLLKDDYILFFSRLLFPTYFFDCMEKNGDIKIYTSKINQYERFLRYIYIRISSKVNIPRIDWIIKKI